MKLRNKKTGEVFDLDKMPKWLKESIQLTAIFYSKECEVYEPAEPLIKDEKIRKAVRAWAEANNYPKTMELYYNAPNFVLRSDISTIEFDKEIEPLRHGDQHTIAELCGEVEE